MKTSQDARWRCGDAALAVGGTERGVRLGMRRGLLRVVGLCVALGPLPGLAQAASGPRLLVLAKKDEQLAVVDARSLKVLGTVPVGGNPHEVIGSPDGRRAWVSNYGNGALNTITAVDLGGMRVEKTIDLGPIRGPHGLTFVDGAVWFTAEREKLVGRIDPASETVTWLLGTGQIGTHMLWVAADASEIVTVNVGAGTMSLMTRRPAASKGPGGSSLSKAGAATTAGPGGPPAPDWEETVVQVGGMPEGFDVIPDANGHARTIWVANATEGTISVVDFATKQVTATIDAGVPTANRLRFTPDHRMALVSREKSGELTVVDVLSGKVTKRVAVGTGAAGVLVEPDGKRAFVSCSPDNKVAVVDLATMAVVGQVEPGREPDGLAWAAGDGR